MRWVQPKRGGHAMYFQTLICVLKRKWMKSHVVKSFLRSQHRKGLVGRCWHLAGEQLEPRWVPVLFEWNRLATSTDTKWSNASNWNYYDTVVNDWVFANVI